MYRIYSFKTVIRYILLFVVIGYSHSVVAQQDSLVNSGSQLQKAKILSDSGKYELAIKELKRIDPRDTNYVAALSRLTDVYLATGEYREVIKTTEEGLSQTSSNRSDFLVSQGMAYTQLGEYEKASDVFDLGINEFPFYPAFVLQKGKMYYAQKKYDEAEKFFFQGLEVSPFNSISHLHLAIISMLRGEKVRGMMAMGLYLSVNNQNNKQLVSLERFVKNQITDEGTISPSELNSFARLDGIIRSRLAMESVYKHRIPIDAGIVRQYQLLFDQLALQQYNSPDPWVKFYLPVYQEMMKNNLQEAFVYHILQSSSIKEVPEWAKKNKAAIEKFYGVVNTSMKKWREKKTLPQMGYREAVTCWYDDESRLESIGMKNAKGDEMGLWHFYHANGTLKASGNFDDQGNKRGTWQYYNNLGNKIVSENHETGLYERLTKDGKPSQQYILKDGKANGEVIIYYECGAVRERLNYKAGVRDGKGEIYTETGQVIEQYNFSSDSLHGVTKTFYEDGTRQLEINYNNGKLDGVYNRYHQNGKISVQGNYKLGKAIGIMKFYHDNGNLSEEGTYTNDIATGIFKIYNRLGELIQTKTYDEGGELVEEVYYAAGKMHSKFSFEQGAPKTIVYVDNNGKELGNFSEINGELVGKAYYPTGQVRTEYRYKDGKATGTWKYYSRAGVIESVYEYLDGQIHGKVEEYYPDQSVKVTLYYENGSQHGPYQSYYSDGKPNVQGWYQYGNAQQQWVSYHPNGKKRADEYFLNDKLTGKSYYYSLEGTPFEITTHRDGNADDMVIFNQEGTAISKLSKEGNKVAASINYPSGKDNQRFNFLCGKMHGKSTIHYPDGRLFTARNYSRGKLTGLAQRFSIFHGLENSGMYNDGNSEGTWTWFFEDGTREVVGHYFNDKRDSVWTYFYDNGKVASTIPYLDGEKQGVSKHYSYDGQLILEKMYNAGDIISYRLPASNDWIEFYGNGVILAKFPDGKPALEENFKNGKLMGIAKAYYPNGKMFFERRYWYGDFEGQQTYYHSDGKIKQKEFYNRDDSHGKWESYDGLGRLVWVRNYSWGYLQGTAEQYTNGKKIKEIKFWYGLPVE